MKISHVRFDGEKESERPQGGGWSLAHYLQKMEERAKESNFSVMITKHLK